MSNVLGTVLIVKLKLSECAKRDVELRKWHSVLTATITTAATFTTTTTEAKLMKMKLSGNVEGDDELYQNTLFAGGCQKGVSAISQE
jgi:hypothetical protein